MEMDRSKQRIFQTLIFMNSLLLIILNVDLIKKISRLKKIKLNKNCSLLIWSKFLIVIISNVNFIKTNFLIKLGLVQKLNF